MVQSMMKTTDYLPLNRNLGSYRIVLIITILLSALYYYPILYANTFYADDAYRINVGFFGWNELGRYFANGVAYLYSANTQAILDIFPLSLFLNILLLSLSSVLLYGKFQQYMTHSNSLFLACIFIINPFLIENMLYRFDSLGMMIAQFLTVLAYTLRAEYKKLWIVKGILLIIALNFYQPLVNLFLALTALDVLLTGAKKEPSTLLRRLTHHIVLPVFIFTVSLLCYYVELYFIGVPSRGATLPINFALITQLIKNYSHAVLLFSYFWSAYFYYIAITIPFIVIALGYILYKKGMSYFCELVIALALLFISTLGPLALLETQFVRPRMLSYFPIIMMMAAFILMMLSSKIKWVLVAPLFACFIFSYQVGSLQRIQSDFERPLFASAAMDISSIKGVDHYYSMDSVPISNNIRNMIRVTPFQGYYDQVNWHTTALLREYSNKDIKIEWAPAYRKTAEHLLAIQGRLKLVINRAPFYRIYVDAQEKTLYLIWDNNLK